MNEYELFNGKTAEFIGLYSSDKMLEKVDVITFQGENYFVSDLMIPKDRKLRVVIWPAKINIPGDIEDLRLLHWIQQNLTGLKIRLSNEKNSIEGKVTDFWPGIKIIPPENIKPGERQETFSVDKFPDRLGFLTLGPDNPVMVDLLDFFMIEILSK